MLKDQADQVVAELCKRFKGREIATTTSGNEDARDAGIDQHYKVRLEFPGGNPARGPLERDELADLLEVAEIASTEENSLDLDLTPYDDGGLFVIRAVFE